MAGGVNWTKEEAAAREGIPLPPRAKGRVKPPRAMNKVERDYAAHLAAEFRAGVVKWWRWESIKLRISDSCFITIDFFVMTEDGFLEAHDTKGCKVKKSTTGERYGTPYIEEDAQVKLRAVAEMFPFQVKAVYFHAGAWQCKEF